MLAKCFVCGRRGAGSVCQGESGLEKQGERREDGHREVRKALPAMSPSS